MKESLMYPRLPRFRPVFDRPAPVAPPEQTAPAGVAWLTAMAEGFISDAVQDSSTDEDHAVPTKPERRFNQKG
jgi:hypothetical protein